jgi:hypothetical protein
MPNLQIDMEEEQEWLTVFSFVEGLFECNLMPFGLKSAGNTFVRSLSTIMKHAG